MSFYKCVFHIWPFFNFIYHHINQENLKYHYLVVFLPLYVQCILHINWDLSNSAPWNISPRSVGICLNIGIFIFIILQQCYMKSTCSVQQQGIHPSLPLLVLCALKPPKYLLHREPVMWKRAILRFPYTIYKIPWGVSVHPAWLKVYIQRHEYSITCLLAAMCKEIALVKWL